ncbi:MAG: hypothetical protein LBK60_03155 [Verrucomicrobiales bacterium]|jgi:hypothetical protein|nr:hypothetical protein [Verrucomicrobiales bacterium]
MPNRILRDWSDSEKVNALSWQAEVLFTRLIMKADDFGRFTGNHKLIKAACFPLREAVRDSDICHWLTACEQAALLRVYVVGDKTYLQISNFGQRVREGVKSKYPPPSAAGRGGSPQLAATCGNSPPYSEAKAKAKTKTEAGAAALPLADAEVPKTALTATNAPPFGDCFAQLRVSSPDVPEGFAKLVYADWVGNGCKPRYPDYVRKRWMKSEGEEWRAGVHSEQKRRAETKKQGGSHERKKTFGQLAAED